MNSGYFQEKINTFLNPNTTDKIRQNIIKTIKKNNGHLEIFSALLSDNSGVNHLLYQKYVEITNKLNNYLIIGAGPVGLFLALKILETNKDSKVDIIDIRYPYSRNQILMIHDTVYNEIISSVFKTLQFNLNQFNSGTTEFEEKITEIKNKSKSFKMIFSKIKTPRNNNRGIMSRHINTIGNSLNIYSVELSKLQEKIHEILLYSYTSDRLFIYNPPPNHGNKYTFTTSKNGTRNRLQLLNVLNETYNHFSKPIDSYGYIFSCSGGRDVIANKIYATIGENGEKDINNTDFTYGLISFLKLKKGHANIDYYNIFIRNRTSGNVRQNGPFGFQHRYRLFIDPNRETNKDTFFIYLGIQFSQEELEGYFIPQNKFELNEVGKLYVSSSIHMACNYYDIEKTHFEIDCDYKVFDIKIKYYEKSVIEDEVNLTKLFLVGDSKCKVNFFAGIGVNEGMMNCLAIIDSLQNENVIEDMNHQIEQYLNDKEYGKSRIIDECNSVKKKDNPAMDNLNNYIELIKGGLSSLDENVDELINLLTIINDRGQENETLYDKAKLHFLMSFQKFIGFHTPV